MIKQLWNIPGGFRTYLLSTSLYLLINVGAICQLHAQHSLPFECEELNTTGDLSEEMVEGIRQFFLKELEALPSQRILAWNDNTTSDKLYKIRNRIALPEERDDPKLHLVTDNHLNPVMQMVNGVETRAVRWVVGGGVEAEGILLTPPGDIKASLVLLPDADILPESFAGINDDGGAWFGIGNRLATAGCEIIIPSLINRQDTYSGNAAIKRFTNQPHREWLYRQGYELGRHLIGDEVSKVISAVDWLTQKNERQGKSIPVAVAGYGEGGLLAMYSGLLDDRINVTLISGYVDAREQVWEEPIYRNIWDLLSYFGDAELLSLFGERDVIVEHCIFPSVTGPPISDDDRRGAAPGFLETPAIETVQAELRRVERLAPDQKRPKLIDAFRNHDGTPFCDSVLVELARKLGFEPELGDYSPGKDNGPWYDFEKRQERQVRNLETVYQNYVNDCEIKRKDNFWDKLEGDREDQKEIKAKFRKELWEVLGRLPDPTLAINPRARLVEETSQWTRYEVVLDVWQDVFVWGLLTVPRHIKPGSKRPVVVCQHGLEGLPEDCVTVDPVNPKSRTYGGFATLLAEAGFVTFAPHNPYRGGDKFRVLQRMANPLGFSLFSVIIGQHQRIIQWLKSLDFVDPEQIAFYGLSYGGKTALRVPAVLEDYCLSICSGDFNEWIRKNVSTDLRYSYVFSSEYEMPEWNLGQTFSHAEMAALIAPRPFMVEFGYLDGIASIEWVNYEFGKVRQHYDMIDNPDLLGIDLFIGPHRINGKLTFDFLNRFLSKSP